MKTAELREMSVEALQEELQETCREHCSLRIQHAAQPLPNNQKFSELRKKVARILTILTEKQGSGS